MFLIFFPETLASETFKFQKKFIVLISENRYKQKASKTVFLKSKQNNIYSRKIDLRKKKKKLIRESDKK